MGGVAPLDVSCMHTAVCRVLATCDTKAPCACAVWGDQIHLLALYTRLSLLFKPCLAVGHIVGTLDQP
jgi:hypothetical protein